MMDPVLKVNDQSTFRAYLLQKHDSEIVGGVQQLPRTDLPTENLEVAVEYSSFNYKDAMVVRGIGGLTKNYPHVPGIDLVGTVVTSSDPEFVPGETIIVTGWHVGERYWGGFSTLASLKSDYAISLPTGISPKDAMILGTAGLSAMLGTMALETQGLCNSTNYPVLVTGATGGVGSLAVLLLSNLGYSVTAVTRRMQEAQYLFGLGAKNVIEYRQLIEDGDKPLQKQKWSGAIDTVGGHALAVVASQLINGGSIAAIGLVGGTSFTSSMYPFLLRGINILGIDSTTQPKITRLKAWQRLIELQLSDSLRALAVVKGLNDIDELATSILAGKLRGRVVIDPST